MYSFCNFIIDLNQRAILKSTPIIMFICYFGSNFLLTTFFPFSISILLDHFSPFRFFKRNERKPLCYFVSTEVEYKIPERFIKER